MCYHQNSTLYPQPYTQNAQLGGFFSWLDEKFAALDPTNHNSWLGEGLHNAADWAGDITGIDAQELASLVSTGLNFIVPGAGSALNAVWGGALAASAAETHASWLSDQMNANIEKAKIERIGGIETVATSLAKQYPNSPELIPLYKKGATDALNALFSGDMQAKVNPTSLAALDAILKGSLISTQKLAAQQKEFNIANPSTSNSILSKDAKSTETNNTLMYAGIVAGVVAIAGIGTAIYMKNKKKKDV